MTPTSITSRDNPLVVRLRKLARDPQAYRRLGQVWLEGDHLCEAAVSRGVVVAQSVIAASAAQHDARLMALAERAERVAVLADALMAEVSSLESPAPMGFVLTPPQPAALDPLAPTVVLDRLQDPGNAGSILRSAAAFGFRQVLALKGTVGLWSPKVLRAGMGAHFTLQIVEGQATASLSDLLQLPLVATSSHATTSLPDAALPVPCAWILGHEGQGIDAEVAAHCALTVRIPQPGGEESLNVAAAAAICLYESVRRRG